MYFHIHAQRAQTTYDLITLATTRTIFRFCFFFRFVPLHFDLLLFLDFMSALINYDAIQQLNVYVQTQKYGESQSRTHVMAYTSAERRQSLDQFRQILKQF